MRRRAPRTSHYHRRGSPRLSGREGIAVDDASVYWTTGGSVQKIPISGGHVSTIAAGQNGATSVIVDQNYVYWANTGGGTIGRASK